MTLPEVPASRAHGFTGEDHAALGHPLLCIPIAQAKAKVEPDAAADDLCREPMTLMRVG